jgi:glycerophosphoryl diester phosphodiesterase
LPATFDVQGHRGARGLSPENTLPSFEAALDLGVSSIETDVQLSADGVPVLCHDPVLSAKIYRPIGPAAPDLSRRPPLSAVTLEQLRALAADRNPDPERFPEQSAAATPLAAAFALVAGLHPFTPPTLADCFTFVAAYARHPKKTDAQRAAAARLTIDLELKRFPFADQRRGDGFAPTLAGPLECEVIAAVKKGGLVGRTRIRSFDHRAVRAVKRLEPRLATAVLVAGTTPVDPVGLVRAAGADWYCPEYSSLDRPLLGELHAAGLPVMPWTVNDPDQMRELIAWGVDGITTDYPDRLLAV